MAITARDIVNPTGSTAAAARVKAAFESADESADIGDLGDLDTTEQGTVVGAINEVLGAVGDITTLTTTEKGSAVGAVNELDAEIGDLGDLDTTEKGTLVGAIDEVHGDTATAQTAANLALARQATNTVRLATTAPLPACTYLDGVLTGDANGALADQDGVTPAQGDLLLVKDQVDTTHNGVYVLTDLGDGDSPFVLTRHAGFAVGAAVAGRSTFVREGSTLADTTWHVAEESGSDVVGTDTLSWARYVATPASAQAAALASINSLVFSQRYAVEDLGVSADIINRPIYTARGPITIKRVTVAPRGTAAGIDLDGGNTCAITVEGPGAVQIATKTFNDNPGGVDHNTPFPEDELSADLTLSGTPADLELGDGEQVKLTVTQGGTSDIPAFDIIVEWSPRLS